MSAFRGIVEASLAHEFDAIGVVEEDIALVQGVALVLRGDFERHELGPFPHQLALVSDVLGAEVWNAGSRLLA
jgi:hypothetical protein